MKLKIRNGELLLTEAYAPLVQSDKPVIPLDVSDVRDRDNFRFEVSFGGKFNPVDNGKVSIPDSLPRTDYVTIKVRQINLSDGSQRIYESDRLPLVRYIHFGPQIEHAYPRIIQRLEDEIKALQERVQNLEDVGDVL